MQASAKPAAAQESAIAAPAHADSETLSSHLAGRAAMPIGAFLEIAMREYNYVQPAFPCEVDPDRLEAGSHQTGPAAFEQYGMTLRDYFAAKAVQGYCSREGSIDCNADDTAADAYAIADAMLKEREYRP